MTIVEVAGIWVDDRGRLFVTPREGDFSHIHRDASGVEWDASRCALHSPVPREWTLARWYQQIAESVQEEYGVRLTIGLSTQWHGVSESDQATIRGFVLGPRSSDRTA